MGENDSANIIDSYNTGSVDGGGLIGESDGASVITNSYWDMDTSGQTTSDGGTGLADSQMKRQSSFVGWDFTNTWGMNGSYPSLKHNH